MKIFKIVSFLLGFAGICYADDPVFIYPIISSTAYFQADRDPTSTEPVVNSTLTIGSWTVESFPTQFYWLNDVSNTIFDYMGGANGAMVWVARGYTAPARVFTANTPTLNSAVQLSPTRDMYVSYPVDIQVSSLLLGNASGTAYLVYADTASCVTSTTQVAQGTNSTSGVLSLVNTSTVTLTGIIPAGKYACVHSVTNSGTVSFTARPGQEVAL